LVGEGLADQVLNPMIKRLDPRLYDQVKTQFTTGIDFSLKSVGSYFGGSGSANIYSSPRALVNNGGGSLSPSQSSALTGISNAFIPSNQAQATALNNLYAAFGGKAQ